MADNGPISVSAPGKSLTNAVGKDVTFSTRYPFYKLDSTNKVSFQLTTIFFATDTPNPDGSSTKYVRTQVYQFAHGYTYVPSTWFLVMEPSGSTTGPTQAAVGTEGYYIVGGGAFPTYSAAVLIIKVDSTNVTFYIDKYYDTSIIDLGIPSILGLFLTIRSYVAVNDLLGNDIPSQA